MASGRQADADTAFGDLDRLAIPFHFSRKHGAIAESFNSVPGHHAFNLLGETVKPLSPRKRPSIVGEQLDPRIHAPSFWLEPRRPSEWCTEA